jgi:cytochrome P450 family 142 subfamily A polypeptide 1
MTTTDAPTINLLDPQFYVDPYEAYRWLRDNDPVHWDATHRLWGVSRYEDVVEVEKQTGLYSSLWGSRPATDQLDDTSMINKDDPEHQRQRMLVARQFTPRAVKQLEDHLRGLVTELIDAVAAEGTCEAIAALASPLPAITIGDKLGYPRELWSKVRHWSEVTMYESGQNPPDGSPQPQSDTMIEAMMDFAAVTMELIAQRRDDPQQDLISLWATTEVDGRRWTDGEILSECLLLLDGGAETTRTVIGSIRSSSTVPRCSATPRWRSSSAGSPRSSTCVAPSPGTTRSAARSCTRATRCSSCTAPRTATSVPSTSRIAST